MTLTNKLLSSLVCAVLLTISGSAFALDTTKVYQAFITHGSLSPIPVGLLFFEFDSQAGVGPTAPCVYVAEWDSTGFEPISGQIWVDEEKTEGSLSCFANAVNPLATVLTLDMFYGQPSTGFDTFDQFRTVQTLMVGESPSPCGLNQGIIEYTGAVPVIYGFEFHS